MSVNTIANRIVNHVHARGETVIKRPDHRVRSGNSEIRCPATTQTELLLKVFRPAHYCNRSRRTEYNELTIETAATWTNKKAGFDERQLQWLIATHNSVAMQRLSINWFDLLDAVLKQPTLFTQKPETINGNVEGSAALLGVGKGQFIAAALKHPQLFYQKAETINGNVKSSAALLGVCKGQLIAAALKHPQLFYQKAETINGNAEGSAALLGVSKAQFVAAAMKQPQIFYQKPATINDNVEGSAALLEVGKAPLVAAALKQPTLFYLRPETINGNVEESAALLGVGKAPFVAAALKQPQLFYQKPATLAGKKPYVQLIGQALGDMREFGFVFQNVPACLGYSTNHLHARFVLAKLGLKRGALSSLLSLPGALTDKFITAHFSSQLARTGTGMRTLQVMHAQGLIGQLPASIRPIDSPTRSANHPANHYSQR